MVFDHLLYWERRLTFPSIFKKVRTLTCPKNFTFYFIYFAMKLTEYANCQIHSSSHLALFFVIADVIASKWWWQFRDFRNESFKNLNQWRIQSEKLLCSEIDVDSSDSLNIYLINEKIDRIPISRWPNRGDKCQRWINTSPGHRSHSRIWWKRSKQRVWSPREISTVVSEEFLSIRKIRIDFIEFQLSLGLSTVTVIAYGLL